MAAKKGSSKSSAAKTAAKGAEVNSQEARKKALDTALSSIEKQFGKGAVMRLGEQSALNVDVISTGSMGLDIALGVGGLPRGRIVEVYGPESSGKTTLALHCIAEAQKLGGEVAFVDVEHALDPVYAAALGVNIDTLLVSQPDSGDDALEITEALVRSGALDMIVVDSVAALTPRAEIERAMGESSVGMLARLMSQAMRKLTSIVGKTKCIAIFINQFREKIGVMYGSPEVTTGGRALKYAASVRIEVRKDEVIKQGSETIGVRTRAKVAKNKVAPPFREAYFDIIYGKGISRAGELLDAAVTLEIVQKSGAWYSYNGSKLGQGRDNSQQFLAENPELAAEIEAKVRENATKLARPVTPMEDGTALVLDDDLPLDFDISPEGASVGVPGDDMEIEIELPADINIDVE